MLLLASFLLMRSAATTLEFFHLTDIHIEPFYDASNLQSQVCRRPGCNAISAMCPLYGSSRTPSAFDKLGRPGCDPPLGLLTSALESMKLQNPSPQFILLSGDYNGHGLLQPMIETVQNTVFDAIRSYFPSTLILPGIGNNDQNPTNTNSDAELTRLASLFSQKANLTEKEKPTFLSGGYWHYHDAVSNLRVILLNSNLIYGKTSQPNSTEWLNKTQQQFIWLEQKFQNAREDSAKVIIGSHIPPGQEEGEDSWMHAPLLQYRALVEKYSDTVLLQVFGHHSSELIRAFSPTFGLSAASGFAPRIATIATYQLISHNFVASGQTNAVAKEISSFYLDLNSAAANPSSAVTWPLLYNMTSTYGVPDVSPSSLYAIVNKIVSDQASANKYFSLQMRSPLNILNMAAANRVRLICETTSSQADAINDCVARISAGSPPASPGLEVGYILGAVVLTAALLTVAGGAFYLLLRKRVQADQRQMLIGD